MLKTGVTGLRTLKYFGVIFASLWLLFYVFDRHISGMNIFGLVFLTPLFTAIGLFFASWKENISRDATFKGTVLNVQPTQVTKREKRWLRWYEVFVVIMLLFILYIKLEAMFT